MSDPHGHHHPVPGEEGPELTAPSRESVAPAQAVAGEVDHLVGMAFDKVTRADEVLLSLLHLAQEGQITLSDAVVVSKAEGGRVHVRQTVDPTPTQGALTGTIWGMFAGLLFADPFVGGLLGAASGALMARLVDHGLDDRWVKEVGRWLDPGTSALLLLVADGMQPATVRELSRFEGRVLYCTFPDAVRRELERALADAPAELSPPAADPAVRVGEGPDAPATGPT